MSTALLLVATLIIAVVVTGLAGGHIVRAAGPLFARAPRGGAVILSVGVVVWLAAVAAVGLMLAWLFTGPTVLPAPLADVCQRCLAAASPFGAAVSVTSPLPTVLALLVPAAGALALAVVGIVRAGRRQRASRAAGRRLAHRSRPALIAGVAVRITDDAAPIALSLPQRHGGIVVSRGLCDMLTGEELTAVLAHEQAHLTQRHHRVAGVVHAIAAPLAWIPLVAAVRETVPVLLEIAADGAAQRVTGTRALASALLKLGRPQSVSPFADVAVLHAAGPERIRHLVAPVAAREGAAATVVLVTVLAAFALAVAAIVTPYVTVVFTGCPPLG